MSPLWTRIPGWWAVHWRAGTVSYTYGVTVVYASNEGAAATSTIKTLGSKLPGFTTMDVNPIAEGTIPNL